MSDSPRRTLPPLPHLDKLRREAKARLAQMRSRTPSARLADAQFLLARDYGFESWAALKTEVARRNSGPEAAALREGRARGALFRAGRRAREDENDPQSPAPFFGAAMAVTVAFALMAIVGLALVFTGGSDGRARLLTLVHHYAGHAP